MGIADVAKTFVMHHLAWVILVSVGLVGIHAYLGEHDARLLADQKVAVAEQQVKVLQTDIQANNAAIADLKTQMTARDAQNATIIAQLVKAKQQAVTPPQQVQVLQTEAKLPEPIVSLPGTPDWRLPVADVQPLFQAVSDGLIAQQNNLVCQADLKDQKDITAKDESTIADQTKQIALKDDEIKALKKPKSFWHRVGGTFKSVGIGIGIGIALGHKF
jgi:hypothetical protein